MKNDVSIIIRPTSRYTRCPKCYQKFLQIHQFRCPDCDTVPERYELDLHHQKERIRICSDETGLPLDSYERAYKLAMRVDYDLRKHIFDPKKYRMSDAKKYLFEVQVIKWLDAKSKEGIQTVHKYRQIERDYFFFFLGHDVREIRTMHVDDFCLQLPSELSGKTKKHIMSTLKAFLNWLLNREVIEKLPRFPKIRHVEADPKWLTEQEQDKVLSKIPFEDRPIYIFLANHGCRPSEARSLKIKDINFERMEICICSTFSGISGNIYKPSTKNGHARTIPIHPDLFIQLQAVCKNRFGEDYVFLNPRTKRHYCHTTYGDIWRKARDEAGYVSNSYQGLRHSFASQRVNVGSSLALIGKVMGHRDSRVTNKYAHVNVIGMRSVMQLPCQQSVNGKAAG